MHENIGNMKFRLYKAFKVEALNILTSFILMSPRESVLEPATLTLIALICYMCNAQCARPEEGDRVDNIKNAALKHSLDEMGREIPVSPFGSFFIRGISYRNDHTPYLSVGRVAFNRQIAELFGKATYDEVIALVELPNDALPPPPTVHPLQTRTNKRVNTSAVEFDRNVAPLFHLEERRVKFPRLPGDSEDANSAQALEGYNEEALSADQIATKFWMTFFSDLGQKAWVTRGKRSAPHLLVPEDGATEDFFKEMNLASIFTCVGFRKANTWSEWSTNFDHMFLPFQADPPPKQGTQNYWNMKYFNLYLTIRARFRKRGDLGKKHFTIFRQSLRVRFNQLMWVPFAQRDRLFTSRTSDRGKSANSVWPRDHTGPAPVILVHPERYDAVQRLLDRSGIGGASSEQELEAILVEN